MSLEAKLKRISSKKKKKDAEIDWNKQRDIWIRQVDKLYSDIEEWLKVYIDKEYISLSLFEKTLFEEHIGEYRINVLEIDLGEPLLVFRPIGKNIIGADGRVDVFLSGHLNDKKMLLLTEDEQQNSLWELWPTKDRKDMKPFDRESLEKILEDWLQYY